MKFSTFFYEQFDTITQFLSDPKNKDVNFDDLLKSFEASGGKILGSGRHGTVYEHPNWPYVLKTFASDDCYLRFARFAFSNPHSAFPKIYDIPKKIIPQFTRPHSLSTMYIVRMEKLYPIDEELAKMIINQYGNIMMYKEDEANGFKRRKNAEEKYQTHWKQVENLLKQYPKLDKLFDGMYILEKHPFNCALDLGKSNFMQRKDGSFVFSDPLWAGESLWAAHDRAMRAEIGYDYDDYQEPKMVQGGKLPKKERPVKPRKSNYLAIGDQSSSEIPF